MQHVKQLLSLEGRTALVTGGGGGLGGAMALALAQAGADIVLFDLHAEPMKQNAALIEKEKRRCVMVGGDVRRVEDIERAVQTAVTQLGRLDIAVNSAGVNIRKPAHELTLAEWRQVIDINLTSAFLCSRDAHPHLKRAGGGKIINIGSMMSIFGASFAPAYAASKGGIVQLTKATAVAWAPDNIQVNAVLPGWIDTELTRNARTEVKGLHEGVLARTPAGRWGTIDDMEGIAIFLASTASDFITGTAIPVDGGYAVKG